MNKTFDKKILIKIKQVIFKQNKDPQFKYFLFGSRVDGTAKKKSDYDIGVIGNKRLDSITRLNIEECFENIPALIDFVDFSEVNENFKTIAMKNIKWLTK